MKRYSLYIYISEDWDNYKIEKSEQRFDRVYICSYRFLDSKELARIFGYSFVSFFGFERVGQVEPVFTSMVGQTNWIKLAFKGLEDMIVQAYLLSLDSKQQPEASEIPKVSCQTKKSSHIRSIIGLQLNAGRPSQV